MDWSNTGLSLMAVFRYMMYDYNLDAMSSSFPTMASIFYVTMMLLLTNMVLWMFLAIVLESYTEVRARSRGAPSLLDDAASAWVVLPRASALLHAATCGRLGQPSAGLRDVIDALNGRLRDEEEVSAAALAAGVPYLHRHVAEELILDAIAWSASGEGGSGGGGAAAADKDEGAGVGAGQHRRAFWMPMPSAYHRASYSQVRAGVKATSFAQDEGGNGGGSSSGSGGGGGAGGADVRARAAALSSILERARAGGGDGGATAALGDAEILEELAGEAARFIKALELAKRGGHAAQG
jgi:hypothetical protein